MIHLALLLALSSADKIAHDWNADQQKHVCTEEVTSTWTSEDGTPIQQQSTQVCPERAHRMPSTVPDGYYLKYEVPYGWMLEKAQPGDVSGS